MREHTRPELSSAERGHRVPRYTAIDLLTPIALRNRELAERLLAAGAPEASVGALHFAAKRNVVTGVCWLLEHDFDPTRCGVMGMRG